VAEDVRKLAERSAVATKDIGAFIQSIVNSTSEANHIIEEFAAWPRRWPPLRLPRDVTPRR